MLKNRFKVKDVEFTEERKIKINVHVKKTKDHLYEYWDSINFVTCLATLTKTLNYKLKLEQKGDCSSKLMFNPRNLFLKFILVRPSKW